MWSLYGPKDPMPAAPRLPEGAVILTDAVRPGQGQRIVNSVPILVNWSGMADRLQQSQRPGRGPATDGPFAPRD